MSQPSPGPPYSVPPQDHPQATTILVLGVCGLLVCQVLGPFAWLMGNKALREIDASQGQIGGRDSVNMGRTLGLIGTVLLGMAVVALILVVGLFGVLSLSVANLPTAP